MGNVESADWRARRDRGLSFVIFVVLRADGERSPAPHSHASIALGKPQEPPFLASSLATSLPLALA